MKLVSHIYLPLGETQRMSAFHLYVIALSLKKTGGGGSTAFKIESFAGGDWILALYKVI